MKSKEVLEILKQKKLTISFAESMTGGRVISELIKHAGASLVCELGLVVYSTQMKEELLDISKEDIRQYGVVSKMISMIMAENVSMKSLSNVGVGITGNAGPTIDSSGNLGEVWVSIFILGEMHSYHFQFNSLPREEIIEKTTQAVFMLLSTLLKEISP